MSFDSLQEDEPEEITVWAYLYSSLKKRYCLYAALVLVFKRL